MNVYISPEFILAIIAVGMLAGLLVASMMAVGNQPHTKWKTFVFVIILLLAWFGLFQLLTKVYL